MQKNNSELLKEAEVYDHDIRVRLTKTQSKYLVAMSKTYKKTLSFLIRRLINADIKKGE
jgi:hypothetical protein